jgi:hypothetical protein
MRTLYVHSSLIARAIFIESILVLLFIPALNYRGALFFALMDVFILSPFILVGLALLFLALISALSKRWAMLAASLLIFVAFVLRVVYFPIHEPRWIAHGKEYRALADAIGIALISIPPAVGMAIPFSAALWVIVKAIKREFRAAAGYLAVPFLAFGAPHFGTVVTDHFTVQSCAAGLQSALRSGDSVPLSQAHPITTIGPHHKIAICGLNSPLFDANYIVDDPLDSTNNDVARRIGGFLDAGHCSVSARRVERYYWVSEAC